MRVTDFSFELPELDCPLPTAGTHRRFAVIRGSCATHGTFTDLLDSQPPRDLLVFNNTRVIPARLFWP